MYEIDLNPSHLISYSHPVSSRALSASVASIGSTSDGIGDFTAPFTFRSKSAVAGVWLSAAPRFFEGGFTSSRTFFLAVLEADDFLFSVVRLLFHFFAPSSAATSSRLRPDSTEVLSSVTSSTEAYSSRCLIRSHALSARRGVLTRTNSPFTFSPCSLNFNERSEER